MRVCVPTQEDKGMDSPVYGHFGSASYFVIYDTESKTIQTLPNMNQHHEHGACNPMKALGNESVQAVLVGGIGKRAIDGLNSMGIKVFQSIQGNVQDNVQALQQGILAEFTSQNACAGHSHGIRCGH